MRKSFDLINISGFQISIHWSWLFVFLLVISGLSTSYYPNIYPNLSGIIYWIMGIISAIFLFASVLTHEYSHSYIARKNGVDIRGITLFLFGGVAKLGKEPEDPISELKIAIAGPFVSICLGIIFLGMYYLLKGFVCPPVVGIVVYLAAVNFILAIFNLIPAFPLDGGRVLRAFFWKKTGNLMRATYIASNLGKGFAYLLIFWGATSTLLFNFRGIWYVLLGLFLHQAAKASYRQVEIEEGLAGIRVEDIMNKDVVIIDSSLFIQSAVEDYFYKFRYDSFPVLKNGNLVGIIELHHIKDVPREEWITTKIENVMENIKDDKILHPEESAVSALKKIILLGYGRLPVTVHGQVVGMLTRRDIMELLKIKSDLS